MKRFCLLAVLMALSPSAQAGSSISFSVGGHRIHVEASPHCRSVSCASVSISGIYDSRRQRDRFDDDDAPVKPMTPAPQIVSPPSPSPPASSPPVQTIVASPPPTVYKPAAAVTQTAAAPPPLVQPVAITLPPPPPSVVQQVVAIPVPPPLPPAPVAKPAAPSPVERVSQQIEQDAADTPIGDWQTQGKGSVRIGRCGNALCGYILNSASNDRGEAVLINMKARNPNKTTDPQWTGSVYSHDSGDTYYGTMAVRGANTLRVEACALGRFYCSVNDWTRITGEAESLVTSRQVAAAPRS